MYFCGYILTYGEINICNILNYLELKKNNSFNKKCVLLHWTKYRVDENKISVKQLASLNWLNYVYTYCCFF